MSDSSLRFPMFDVWMVERRCLERIMVKMAIEDVALARLFMCLLSILRERALDREIVDKSLWEVFFSLSCS